MATRNPSEVLERASRNSATQFTAKLMAFMVTIVVAMALLFLVLVQQIFDYLAPTIAVENSSRRTRYCPLG